MKPYLAHIRATLKLTMRDRIVLFFNYLLPLLFFVVFAQSFGGGRGGALSQAITMVLIMGVLGSGFFGAGLRAVQERELNILRRFKVAPITPMPLLLSSLVTGLITYLPSLALILAIARFWYGMPFPQRWLSLVLLLALGLVTFRAVGLTIAAVVNSMQESQIIIQLLYLPMLFLSGATFPVSMLPDWLQVAAQFLPTSYLYTGLTGILVRNEGLRENWVPAAAMLIATAVALFLAAKLFRWEKDERLPARAKFWIAAVLLPFLAMGAWQTRQRGNITKAKVLYREMNRNRALVIRGPRIFAGDGKVIAAGGLLVRNGRIAAVYDTIPPENQIAAEVVEAAGKTVLPGLIDAGVHLSRTNGEPVPDGDALIAAERFLAAYLYCGVVAVRSVDPLNPGSLLAGEKVSQGERLGAELITTAIPANAAVPALSAQEAADAWRTGRGDLLERSLTAQVAPEGLIASIRQKLSAAPRSAAAQSPFNIVEALRARLPVAMGTGSGAPLLVHGPALHRELQLWAQAGVPPEVALRAATSGNAALLGLDSRLGLLRPGFEASFLIVDGNPLEDIAATERISAVFFRGEHVDRQELLR